MPLKEAVYIRVLALSGQTVFYRGFTKDTLVRDVEQVVVRESLLGNFARLWAGETELDSRALLADVVSSGDTLQAMISETCFVEEDFKLCVNSRKMAQRVLDALHKFDEPVSGWYLTCAGQTLSGVRLYEWNPRPASVVTEASVSMLVERVLLADVSGMPWQELVLDFQTRKEDA